MKTATQSGWYLAGATNFVSLYDAKGNYLEAWADAHGIVKWSGDFCFFDLPQSVIELVCLWLEVAIIPE